MNLKTEDLFIQLNTRQDFAIGNDVVYLPDFEKSFNDLFKQKVYTSIELSYCDLFEHAILRYASTWAAKEAAYKAIKQLHKGPLPFKKIEIVREKISGKPLINLPAELSKFKLSLTISHDGDYIWAAVFAKI